jgi:hypothetical protein
MRKERKKTTGEQLRPLLIRGSIAATQVLAILAVTFGNIFLMIAVSTELLTRTGLNILFAILPIPLYGFATILITEGILSIRAERLTNRIEKIVSETLDFPRRKRGNET